jgi:hypothetical protein
MRKRRTGAGHTPPEYCWEVAFEREVRRVPVDARAGLLGWLRRWRRRPGRVFWVVDSTGRWRRLS